MSTSEFLTQLSRRTLVADGATGTNFLKRGLPRGVPSDLWVLENPQAVIQLHRDFVEAGANILLTDTFGATRLRLARSKAGERAVELNQQAVALAREAIGDKQVFVAGSMGPIGELLKPMGPLAESDAEAAFTEQARALAEAGVDLLVVETQFDLAEAKAALRAVRSVTDLPLVCSFSFDRGTRTMMGVKPGQLAAELEPLGVDLIGVNCGRSLDENLKVLREVRATTQLPLWFKPNAGLPHTSEHGETTYAVAPEEMGAQVSAWVEAGAAVVGGCCGTSPEHLRRIALAAGALREG